jgi:hypothetical protein
MVPHKGYVPNLQLHACMTRCIRTRRFHPRAIHSLTVAAPPFDSVVHGLCRFETAGHRKHCGTKRWSDGISEFQEVRLSLACSVALVYKGVSPTCPLRVSREEPPANRSIRSLIIATGQLDQSDACRFQSSRKDRRFAIC